MPHVVADLGPDCEERALAFVVTRSVGVRFTEVPDDDGSVDGAYDRAESDVSGRTGKDVTTADPAL